MLKKSKINLIFILLLAAILRFYQLGINPPALYWDEASLGYNAFSILKFGIDEHGKSYPTTNFAAFGDYKPPLYIYLSTIPIAIFGLNEFSIRFASALFGSITVFIAYCLAKKLFENDKTSLLTALLLAISPWHVQLSRGAFEGNVGLFFSSLGILFFIKFAKDNPKYIFISSLAFLSAMYTFTGQRLFVPVILPVLVITFISEIKKNIKIIATALIISGIIFYPLFNFSVNTIEGMLRFEEVTIFKDLDPINKSTHYIEADNNSFLSRLIHNRRFFFAREYLINYFDAFDPDFLFAHGDGNPRLSIRDIGELYYFELPLILAGTYLLIKNNQKYKFLIFSWLLISPLGPATARETPHALRMVHILPTFQLIAAYGAYHFIVLNKYKRVFLVMSIPLILISVFYYLHQYYSHYPKTYSGEWQYGYKQAVKVANENYDSVNKIIVTQKLGRPYIYFLLFSQSNPKEYLKSSNIVIDNFFFYHVNSFDKYIFTDDIEKYANEPNAMYIVPSGKLPQGTKKIETIKDLGNYSVFDIGKSEI